MNEFGPKSTLEDLECYIKNRNVRIALRPPRYNSPMWMAVIRNDDIKIVGSGDRAWIALDEAAKKLK